MGKRYIAYEIENIQPILIANLDISKSGEIETLQYLPGSTLRGMVIANLKKKMEDEAAKQKILTKAIFYNGYPMEGEQELLPSPKGFYENKQQDGTLKNIVADTSTDIEGCKRAALGRFCKLEGDTVCYTSVEQEDILNIAVKDKNIFRKNMLSAGQRFRSYIAVEKEEEELYEWLTEALNTQVCYIGSSRTSGFGKCEIHSIGEVAPYKNFAAVTEKQKEVYLYLASNMSMRNAQGEICGIDLKALAGLLKVEKLALEAASTSVCKMSGVNRTWGCRTPEIVMYEAGSVFKLKSEQEITPEAMKEVCQNGIGVKREEGCGQVLFLRDYAGLNKKNELLYEIEKVNADTILLEEEKEEQLKFVAKEIAKQRIEKAIESYIANGGKKDKENIKKIPKSQRGIMLNYAKYAHVEGIASVARIEKYLEHEKEKLERNKKQSDNKGKRLALEYLEKIMALDIFDELDLDKNAKICEFFLSELFTMEELQAYKMELLERVITFENRRERGV